MFTGHRRIHIILGRGHKTGWSGKDWCKISSNCNISYVAVLVFSQVWNWSRRVPAKKCNDKQIVESMCYRLWLVVSIQGSGRTSSVDVSINVWPDMSYLHTRCCFKKFVMKIKNRLELLKMELNFRSIIRSYHAANRAFSKKYCLKFK